MKTHRLLGVLLLAGLFPSAEVEAQNFAQLWQVGIDNGNQTDFGQEVGGATAAPGSATIKDDDWYFAGVYPDPIGIVSVDEPFSNFERAILVVDPAVRIHFNLADINADPAAEMRLLIDLCCTDHSAHPEFGFTATGPISFTATFNGVEVLSAVTSGVNDAAELFTTDAFTAASVGATTGENIITIERPTTGGGSWMQFDFIRLEVDASTLGCDEPICTFATSRNLIQPGESATLNWVTRPGSTLEIDNGIGSVDDVTTRGAGSIDVSPTQSTTYTLLSNEGGEMEMATVTVTVDIITTFTSNVVEVPSGSPVTLNWNTDPTATLTIDQGVGSVPAGVSSVDVVPTELETVYTMTATRGAEMEIATVMVFSNPFTRLWTVGIDNGNTSDFGQETGGSEPSPGSPTAKDDDWYFAGVYPDPIGIVTVDEALENFERALTKGDTIDRIHFNLSEAQAEPTALFRVRIEVCCTDHANPVLPGETIDYAVLLNGISLLETTTNGTDGAQELVFTPAMTGQELGMGTGENIVTIQRQADQGGNWMQFDLVALETMPGIPEELFQITGIEFTPGTGLLEITWVSRPGETYGVDTSTGLVVWNEITDNAASQGTRTTYTTTVDYAMTPALSVRVRLVP